MTGVLSGKKSQRPRLFSPQRVGGTEADKLVAEVLEMIDYSADSKREIEREGQMAFNHMMSHIDESRMPWASKVYDPVFSSAQISRLAKAAEAIYASPPVCTYDPGEKTTHEAAEKLTALSEYHDARTRPRRAVLNGYGSTTSVGTHFWHSYWDYREQEQTYWKRVPLGVDVLDPITGQASKIWVEEGKTKLVRTRRIVMDSPRVKSLHITNCFPDDRDTDVQGGEWFGFVEYLTDEQCRERAAAEDWDEAVTEEAIGGALAGETLTSIRDRMDWLSEIGLRTSNLKSGLEVGNSNGRKTVEAIELWRRRKGKMERIVVLNRSGIAWKGPSPFGHGQFPFLMARNFVQDGMFWGLSDYRMVRYLIRAIQSMLNAGLSEAEIATMPPLLIQQGTTIVGKRFEPRSEWYVNGPLTGIQWFQPSGVASGIAQSQVEFLRGRMDVSIGSSDVARGGLSGDASRAKATTTTALLESAGIREKMHIDDFADEFIEPWYEQKAALMEQFQDHSVEVRLSGDVSAVPVTVYPEDFRGMKFYARSVASTSQLKALKQKQVMDLYNLGMQYHDANLNPRKLTELVLDVTFPEYKDQVLMPEQVQAQMQPPGVPPMMGGGAPATQYQSPMGGNDVMQGLAQDMAVAYGSR